MPHLRKIFSIFLATFLGIGLFAGAAHALILQSGRDVFLNEYVTEDVYLAGSNVTIQQDIDGDLFIGGGNITINGIVNGDVFVAGGNVLVNSQVQDDVRVLGGALSINGNVGGDLILLGGSVDVKADTTVEGDVLLLAGNANLYGIVNKGVRGVFGRLVVGGRINGNVDVRATEKFVLLDTGHIGGNVTYFAPGKMEDYGGIIDGKISFNKIMSNTEQIKSRVNTFLSHGRFVGITWNYLSLLLIGLVIMAFVPFYFHRTSEQIRREGLRCLGKGFLVFVLGGVASVIAFFTVVGVQLSFIVVALLFVLGEVGKIAAGYWAGSLLLKEESKRGTAKIRGFWRHFLTLAIGLLILNLLGILPVIGWMVGFVTFLIGAGAIFLVQMELHRHLRKEKMV
ncbi:MAG: hypothetical protein UT55_C0022G0002 [Candidatus Peregrinibacteria bacterium GW2011_GWE2_39_6]|nr:MAG: hypothetical protein UT36_C0006G0019 [Candidatus Peregrinibacteria bacterium GW2011_GWF2_39_17]KKR25984.1 MAG: hypothetical protein UT55_C0022G0002 [Candidatus Peregrinibacteria bacterium GW2011_GWE2_39_6]HCW32819.1 hypothetical protein [Candidatus Peregrinibacteria bacterium]